MEKDFKIRSSDDFSDSESSPNTTLYCCCSCCVFIVTALVGVAGGVVLGKIAISRTKSQSTLFKILIVLISAIFWGIFGFTIGLSIMGASI